ncbi:hypothetical protein SAMN04488033_101227 [Salegentibacter agarivorans]|uniref:Uncharacterized protein n=1 Tax=Salegentibacter agarivorans TaxID=345907 RepID=A0A1I2JZS6_9FLAO|nr:hypothetical protein [Salegentibacter agarivorans]SFF59430.1 hypothetical protein SAMN04488033_101227 [Salegentibacter agarivorans]
MKKPKKCISVDKARREQDEWVKTRGKDIREAEGYEDTREFWYSVDELQEYLDYVKEKSKEQGVEKPGIRFYLGAYPKTKEKKSYTTMFLSPTKEAVGDAATAGEDSDPNNYEIEPMNIIQGGHPPRNY